MELESEQKMIRVAMIAVIASGTSWFCMWMFLDYSGSENVVLDTKIVYSGFGEIILNNPEKTTLFSTNTYQDKELGYQISKPHGDWKIHSALDDLTPDELTLLKTKGFIDGVYVEQNHDKKFMLTVFDIQKENFSLHEYVDNQIFMMSTQKNILIHFEQVSPENDWAIFAVEISDTKKYGEQILFLKENRLYMLQYSGDSPQYVGSEQKNDLRFIMDSFELLGSGL